MKICIEQAIIFYAKKYYEMCMGMIDNCTKKIVDGATFHKLHRIF